MSEAFREPERMWVVRVCGDLGEGVLIRQAYLTAGDPQFRIRENDGRWILTAKAGPKSDRFEIESHGSVPNGEALYREAAGGRVDKIRYRSGPWEIDRFAGSLFGLVVMEIERPGDVLPPFPEMVEVITEVTHDARFENRNLAQLGFVDARNLIGEIYGVGGE